MTIDYLDCGQCGATCVPSDDAGMFWDGKEHRCEECGALNAVNYDGEDDVWCDWICKHGIDQDDPCPECDAEEGAPGSAPGEGDKP